ncbi:CAAX farnesyltransferase (FTase) subunit beta [Yamadazyma tenuis]|nr:CAAX farnesyltransferase (FTase) subunit beta [Yamadazyma tenuis]
MITTLPLVEDTYESETTLAQTKTEKSIRSIYKDIISSHKHFNNFFETQNHLKYISNSLQISLPHHYSSLDPNHSWMLYWLINSGLVLNHEFPQEITQLATEKMKTLIVDNGKGGIAGGKNQLGHVASTYAGILLLVCLREYELLDSIRYNLHSWFLRLKQPDGSFVMHYNGEADARSMYCVLVVCSLLNVLTDEIREGALGWIKQTQTYEGGFAGVPNTEAHGGYTFCAFSSLFLLLGQNCNNRVDLKNALQTSIDLEKFIKWVVSRQLNLEGGLSGRSNKLVDACYSFWVGGCYGLLESVLAVDIFDKQALKIYIMNCAQNKDGGFKDKPGKSIDFYHTNYSLMGLSICEHSVAIAEDKNINKTPDFFGYNFTYAEVNDDINTTEINCVFGLPEVLSKACKNYFLECDK